MAYTNDIDSLNPSHAFSLEVGITDRINTLGGTYSGGSFAGIALCEGISSSYRTTGINNRISLSSSNTLNNSAQDRKAVCGWFSVTGIQNPPKSIYGEGDTSQSFRIVLGWGNYLVFEVASAAFILQIFGDTPLSINRPYHLCAVFEGSGFGNEFRAYLDGVEQINAEPLNRQPNALTLPARSVAEFGDPASNVAVGGTQVTLLSPINGQYNEWAMFDGSSASLTNIQIREELFEKGALAETTVTNQTDLNNLAATVRPDTALCIRVDIVGSVTLTADNVTFDNKASIHVQYMGTGTLSWINTNGANAAIGSTPNGGVINFINPATISISPLIPDSEVRVYIAGTETEIVGVESCGALFSSTISFSTIDVIIHKEDHVNIKVKNIDMTNGDVALPVLQRFDINYRNQ